VEEPTPLKNSGLTNETPPENMIGRGGDDEDVQGVDSVYNSYYSDLRTREVVENSPVYDKSPELFSIDKSLKMNYDKILNKPFLIKVVNWKTTDLAYTNVFSSDFPNPFFSTNALVKIPFLSSTLYRAKICLVMQVSGSSMHAGTLIASALPNSNNLPFINGRNSVNNLLAPPHVFLSANNATSACLDFPWYSNTKLQYCDISNTVPNVSYNRSNFGRLILTVLNPLTAPSNAATTVTVSIHMVFKELEFYVPHADVGYRAAPQFKSLPSIATGFIDNLFSSTKRLAFDFLDWGRGMVRQYTGLHNPNIPSIEHRVIVTDKNFCNVVDAHTAYEKLDPYMQYDHVTKDYTFDTSVDEMLVSNIVRKKYFIGKFLVKSNYSGGAVLWARPITPSQEYISKTTVTSVPMGMLHHITRFWKGSLKIHIQCAGSSFHFCKLAVARNYSPDPQMLTKYPVFDDLQNLMVETLEFSAGGQIQTIDLPYLSPLNQLECTLDPKLNSIQHGVYYILLTQPLVSNGTVASDIEFNVYISGGDDLNFYGYATNAFYRTPLTLAVGEDVVEDEEEPMVRAEKQSTAKIPTNISSEANLQPSYDGFNIEDNDFRPLVSVRDIARRMCFDRYYPPVYVQDQAVVFIPISDILGISGTVATSSYSPLQILSRMFVGFTGGLKFRFILRGVDDAKVFFVPPGSYYSSGVNIIYGSQPVPNTANIGGTALKPLVVNGFINDDPTLTTSAMWDTPYTDLPVKKTIGSGSVVSYGDERPDDATVLAANCMLEFTVPYMNACRFVGNGTIDQTPFDVSGYANSLGYVVIAIRQPYLFNLADPTGNFARPQVHITGYAAANDEARFGFQCVSYPITTPTVAYTGGVTGLVTIYNNPVVTAADYAGPTNTVPTSYYSTIPD
jgi:hypothetical protein